MAKSESNGSVETSAKFSADSGELRDNFRLLNQIIEIVPSVVYVRDLRQQKNVFVNRSVRETLGYTPEEITSLNSDFVSSVMHPDDYARIPDREGLFEKLNDGETVEFEYRMRHKSGEWRWFLSRDSIFLRDDGGKPLLIIGTATDITSRKQSEEQLRASEARLSLGVEVADFAICEIDYRANINHLSKEAARLFDLGSEAINLPREQVHAVFHPDDAPALDGLIDYALNPESDGWFALEHRIIRKNGEVRWLNIRKQIFFDENGKPTIGILAAQDITGRKKAQDLLERYRLLSEKARDIVWMVRRDGQIVEVNQAAIDTYGYTRDELLGMNISQLREESTRQQLNKQLNKAFTDGIKFETVHVCKDGSTFPVEVNSTSADFGGERLIMSIIRDISERKEVEKILRDSEERFRLASDAAAALVYDVDLTGKRGVVVHGLERVTGYKTDESDLSSAWWHSLIHPEDLPAHLANFARQIEGGGENLTVYRLRHKNGRWIWVEDRAQVIKDETGAFVQFIGTIVDITTRKQAEEKLQEEKRFSQNIIGAAPTLTYIYDLKTQSNIFISPIVLEILGYTPEEIQAMGSDLAFLLIHPDDKSRSRERFEKFLGNKTDEIIELEYRTRRKDCNYVWLNDRARVFRRDEFGRPTQILGVATDITLRKAAEEARQQFVSLIEETNDFIGMAKLSGEIIYTNPAGCKLVGIDDYFRTRIPDYHPPAVAKMLKEIAIPQVLEKGFWEGDSQFIHFKTGELIDVYQKIFQIRNPQTDELICLATTATDITERKQAEEAMRLSEEHLELLSNSVPALIFYLDQDFRYVSVNNAFTEWFGVERDEIVGLSVREFVGEAAWKIIRPKLARAYAGETVDYEEEVPYAHGGSRWVRPIYTPHRDADGKVVGVIVLITDITERKRAEEALRDSHERLLATQTNAPIGIVETTLDGAYLSVNDEFCRLSGYTRDELLKLTLRELTHPDDYPHNHELFKRLVAGEFPSFQMEKCYICKDGAVVWADVHCTLMKDSDGKPNYIIGAILDITERKKVEEKLRASHDTFRHLVENSPFGIYVVDADFRLAQVSAGAQKIFENVRPLIGRDFAEVLRFVWQEPFASEAINIFRHTLETGKPYHAPSTIEQRGDTGDVEAYDWKIERITLPDGRFGVVCHFYDLSERQRLEAELRASEENYRTLFNSIDQGFARFEMIFDDAGKPIDLMVLEVNQHWERQTGLSNIVGKTIRSLFPDFEQSWLDFYGKVVLTGEPARREDYTVITNRWYSTNAARIGGADSRQIALIFDDITERKIEELNQKLLLRIGELIRESEDADTLFAGVSRLLCERLSAARCLFNTIDLINQTATVRNEYHRDGLPSVIGTVSLKNYSERTGEEVEQGRTVVITNTKTDKRTAPWYKKTYQPEGIGAYIIFPLMRGKLWVATLWVSDTEPREWQDWEISLIETVGERAWLAAEKIRSEQEVRESEERLRLATDAAEMFTWENDLMMRQIKWSDNAAKILGCQSGDLPVESEKAHFFILPEESERVRREFAEALADGKTNFISEFRGFNNRYWQSHCLIVRDSQGNSVKTIGVTQDITARKRNEEKLQTANYRFQIAEEAAKGFNYQWDLESGQITRSLSVEQVLGYSREELPMTWQGWTDLIHPDDKIVSSEAEALEFLNNIGEDRFSDEYRVRHKDGHYIWVMERGLIIRGEAGKISRIIGQTMDVSERKEQEKRLRESEEYRRLLIESARDYAIIGISVEGIILSWSTGAEKMFGYKENEIIGQSRNSLFTPEDLSADVPDKEMAIVLEKGSNDYERWHLRRDGSRFFASGVLQQLRSEGRRLLGFVKIARDQTEKLAAEKALRDREMLQKVVGALEDERQRIARDLHDELGQQLTALQLKIEHCRKLIPDKSINKEIDEIQSIAQNIDKGVDFIAWQFRPAALDDLGLYSALDKFVREWSDYSGVQGELLPSSLKNVRFSMEIETNIYRIAQEALNNINKHAKAKNAELLLEKRDNLIVLIIADDGIGFNLTSVNALNKGIGLIGMQERAALINGKLEIESAPGKGTTIYVCVPVRDVVNV